MFSFRRCGGCGRILTRRECVYNPEGIFGPEKLCVHCGAAVESCLTGFGWLLTIVGAAALCLGAMWWESLK